MTMELFNILAAWACAFSAGVCAFTIWRLNRSQKQIYAEMRLSLEDLNEHYRTSWKLIEADLVKFDARLRALEMMQ
jgi:hypothetical protein